MPKPQDRRAIASADDRGRGFVLSLARRKFDKTMTGSVKLVDDTDVLSSRANMLEVAGGVAGLKAMGINWRCRLPNAIGILTAQTINLPMLFMGAAVGALPLVLIFLIMQRYIVEGFRLSGIKA